MIFLYFLDINLGIEHQYVNLDFLASNEDTIGFCDAKFIPFCYQPETMATPEQNLSLHFGLSFGTDSGIHFSYVVYLAPKRAISLVSGLDHPKYCF